MREVYSEEITNVFLDDMDMKRMKNGMILEGHRVRIILQTRGEENE